MDERKVKVDLSLFLSHQYSLESRLIEEDCEESKSKAIISHLQFATNQLNLVLPEFENGLQWLNTSRPLRFEGDLTGKIVILDFFTYCCINCIHILPTLEEIETKYGQRGVVVVGVHSAKFENEKVIENVISAVLKYNIRHPVVSDSNGVMWNSWAISCWPTLVVLGPNSQVLFVSMGEGNRDLLLQFVEVAVSFFEDVIDANRELPMKLLSSTMLEESSLRFPGKVACCLSNLDVLAIADSGHNRILIVSSCGIINVKIGGDEPEFIDGNFTEARFHSPQGLAWMSENIIYVADTENHAIREIDLLNRTVRTLIGTGKQGEDLTGGKMGLEQAINSPWDLSIYTSCLGGDLLFIAMAGSHQIWGFAINDDVTLSNGSKIEKGICKRLVGSGREENRNNRYPHAAAFAQPSGICLAVCDPPRLIVADSESSTIRSVNLNTWGVQGIVGGGMDPMDLFNYGDNDDTGTNAKLQHPLGVCYSPLRNLLYVADSYNHKVKQINIQSRMCETITLTEDLKFNEPGGLCISNDEQTLYVADTNNHCIKVIDLTHNSVKQFSICFIEDATVSSIKDVTDTITNECLKSTRRKPHMTILLERYGRSKTSTMKSTFFFVVHDTEKLTLNTAAPNSWRLFLSGGDFEVSRTSGDIKCTEQRLQLYDFILPLSSGPLEPMELEVTLYVCDRVGACHVRTILFLIPFDDDDDDGETEQLSEYVLQFTLKL